MQTSNRSRNLNNRTVDAAVYVAARSAEAQQSRVAIAALWIAAVVLAAWFVG